ncbi:hypothetical protein PENSPDRAFT_658386 [Peniophora sp. CONT]|nr:hypothetical protein PENSPDRAFT_658386 [Peniophora sp. CONT]
MQESSKLPAHAQAKKRSAEEPPASESQDGISTTKKRKVSDLISGLYARIGEEDGDEDEDEDEDSETEDDRDYESPRPPQWIVRASRDLRKLDPAFQFNVVLCFGDDGKGRVQFMVQCADCPATLYKTNYGGDFQGTSLEEHVQGKDHCNQVNARIARATHS